MAKTKSLSASLKKASNDARKEEIKVITNSIEEEIQSNLFESGKYEEWLQLGAKFWRYSYSNRILIHMQKPNATRVAGYKKWINEFNRHVKKGEKGIIILAPVRCKKKPKKDENGDEEGTDEYFLRFTTTRVFDVSQTEGEDLPEICHELDAEVDNYEEFLNALISIAPYPVVFEEINNGSNGYCNYIEGKIAIREGMSELQNLKTLVHEISHGLLHGIEETKELKLDTETREVEAESCAYTVCKYLGLDTSDYSFGYIAGWSKGRELDELKGSLNRIQKASMTIIDGIEKEILKSVKDVATEIETEEEAIEEKAS